MKTGPFKDPAVRDSMQLGGNRGADRDPGATAKLERKAARMRGISVAEFRRIRNNTNKPVDGDGHAK